MLFTHGVDCGYRYCGFVRRLRNRMAQSLVLFVKLGVRYLAALRLALEIDTYRV